MDYVSAFPVLRGIIANVIVECGLISEIGHRAVNWMENIALHYNMLIPGAFFQNYQFQI